MKYLFIFFGIVVTYLFFPKSLVHAVEPISISGTVHVAYTDHFTQKNASTSFVLQTHDGHFYPLLFKNGNPTIQAGTQISVQGTQTSNNITVDLSKEHLFILNQPQTPVPVIGEKKIAVILFNFLNDTSTPYSSTEIRAQTFTNADSANGYYKEVSSNQMSLVGKNQQQGDVYEWITIPYTNERCDAQYLLWIESAQQILATQGYDLTGYDAYIFLFPHTPSCSFSGGLAVRNSALINGLFNTYIVGHELGHIFGTGHANAFRCTNEKGMIVPIGQYCTQLEYEDPFDIMAAISRHHNARTKRMFGWINNGLVEVGNGSATFILRPQEFTPGGIQSIRVPKKVEYNSLGELVAAPDQSFYYIEFRQPWGLFDVFTPNEPVIKGVTIRVDGNRPEKNTQLIDTTPQTSSFNDAPLLAGKIFTDVPAGVAVKTQSVSQQSAAVKIEYIPPKIPSTTIVMQCDLPQQGLFISWENGPIGTTFVERCTGQFCENFVQVGSTPQRSFLDTQVTYGNVYTYRVRTLTSTGNMSAYSYPQPAYFACPEPSPTPMPTLTLNKTNVCQETLASVQWDAVPNATQYEVWRCADQHGSCTQFLHVSTLNSELFNRFDQKLSSNENLVYRLKVRGISNGKAVTTFSNIQNVSYFFCDPDYVEER